MHKDVGKLVKSLQRDSSLKAWSLIVTFFGDAVVARGGNVSARTVQTVMSGIGIGEGAVRTAFSRLAGDEWIVRRKIGRESFYELAADGYQPFKSAAVRIYSPALPPVVSYTVQSRALAVKNPAQKNNAAVLQQGMQITADCWFFDNLSSADSDTLRANDFMLLTGGLSELPEWVTDKLLPDTLAEGFALLEQRFSSIKSDDTLDPLESLVLRCLLIHEWRRVLLRTSVLPSDLVPDNWPETRCREFVAALYHKLLPGSEAWLNEHATCADGVLPVPGVDIYLRFTGQFELNN